MKDEEGNTVVTKLDEKTLTEVAQAGGGTYIRAGNSDFGLQGIIDDIRELDEQEFQSVVFEDFNEQYMYFFAIAVLFLFLEILIGERKGRRFKSFDIFTKAAVFVLFTGLSLTATAQVDKKDIRSGNRAFRKGDMEKALLDYHRAVAKDSSSLKAKYNLANTMQMMDDHQQAVSTMTNVPDSLSDSREKAFAWHNFGNMHLSQKEYAKSIEAYKTGIAEQAG